MAPETIALRSDELLRLESAADRVIADFSLGMTKRIGLAVALLHAARVLILDEPFGSLDPVNTDRVAPCDDGSEGRGFGSLPARNTDPAS
jgi:ABC-type nitrate/sulfonate/bicarbonate transport system ATPase subunit